MSLAISVLIPSLPERAGVLAELLACLAPQQEGIEILVLTDNRRRTLGAKRNALMAMAQGRYLCHIDDDELLSANFAVRLIPETAHGVDLVAYDAGVSFNGSPEFRVRTALGAKIEHPRDLGGRYSDITRPPWHWCLWRTDFARQFKFPEDKNWCEDWGWLSQALSAVKTWRKVDEVLFHHRWSAEKTTSAEGV